MYVSDIKKVIKWYNILAENKLLEFNEDETEEESNNEEVKENTTVKKPKPKVSEKKSDTEKKK